MKDKYLIGLTKIQIFLKIFITLLKIPLPKPVLHFLINRMSYTQAISLSMECGAEER